MEVTGYKIREALRAWQLRRDTACGQFEGTLKAFEGEQKPTPETVGKQVYDAEVAISRLQTAQTQYNLACRLEVAGLGKLSLLECVKRMGGLGRIEKMWRGASTVKDGNRYGFNEDERDPTKLVAKRTISLEEAGKKTQGLVKILGSLREAVAVGNARSIDIEGLDAALFE